MPVVPLIVFGIITVISLTLFYVHWGDEPELIDASTRARRTAVVFLFAPDRLLEMSVRGKFEFFSLMDRRRWALLVTTIVSARLSDG
jgi:hypothetical protein